MFLQKQPFGGAFKVLKIYGKKVCQLNFMAGDLKHKH